jgi:hypothetical protein
VEVQAGQGLKAGGLRAEKKPRAFARGLGRVSRNLRGGGLSPLCAMVGG